MHVAQHGVAARHRAGLRRQERVQRRLARAGSVQPTLHAEAGQRLREAKARRRCSQGLSRQEAATCTPGVARARTDAHRADDGSLRGSERGKETWRASKACQHVSSTAGGQRRIYQARACARAARLVGVNLVGRARQIVAAAGSDVFGEAKHLGASRRSQLANAPVQRRALHGAASRAVHRQRHGVRRACQQAARERLGVVGNGDGASAAQAQVQLRLQVS